MSGRFAAGMPTTYVSDAHSSGGGESIVEMALSPSGQVLAVLTQLRVQFWSLLQKVALLSSVDIPSTTRSGDAGHKLAWNPQGRSLAVATLDRRIVFLEADIALENDRVVVAEQDSIKLADVPSRVCVGFEVQLEFGLIVALSATPQALVVCTSGGFLVGVGWNRGRVLFNWGSSSLLQWVCPPASPAGARYPNRAPPPHEQTSDSSRPPKHVVIGGSIIFFCHSICTRLSCFVLSDGSIGLLNMGIHENSGNEKCEGVYHSGLAALAVAMNTTYGLLAISAGDVTLKLVPFHTKTLQLGKGILGAWCDDVKGLGSVRTMSWSRDDTMLCVGFRKRGVAVFHYSGACIMASFGRYEGAIRRTMPTLSRGCAAAAWDAAGLRLVCTGPDSNQLTVVPLRKIVLASEAGDVVTSSSSIVMVGAESVAWLSDGDGGDESTWESLDFPPDYLRENFPIRFSSVSGDGLHFACAGAFGAAVYSRRIRRWRMFSVKSQERQITCVTDPCWLSDLVVVLPVRSHPTKTFELQFYPRFHINETSVTLKLRSDRRPLTVRATSPTYVSGMSRAIDTYLLVLDTANVVRMYAVDITVDSMIGPRSVGVDAVLVRNLTLRDRFENPLAVAFSPRTRSFISAARSGSTKRGSTPSSSATHRPTMPKLLVTPQDHGLVVVDVSLREGPQSLECTLSGAAPESADVDVRDPSQCAYLDIVPETERVYNVWSAFSYQCIFPQHVLLLTHDSCGVTLRWFDDAAFADGKKPGRLYTSRVADADADSVPIGVLPSDGVVVLATEGIDAQPFELLPSKLRTTIKPVLFVHRVLYPVVVELSERQTTQRVDPEQLHNAHLISADAHAAVDDDGLAFATHHLQRLREQGSFVGSMDYLLHLILHDDAAHHSGSFASLDDSGSIGRGVSESAKDRRRLRMLHAAIQLLKQFAEYHTVIVGLVRKVDMSKWRLIFDVIGAPVDVFDDCLASGNYVEAAHIVRVVMMDAATLHVVKDITAIPGLSSLGGTQGAKAEPGVQGVVLAPLQAAMRCGLRLLPHTLIEQFDLPLASELFRFLTLLLVEVRNQEGSSAEHADYASPGSSYGSQNTSPMASSSVSQGSSSPHPTMSSAIRASLSLDKIRSIWERRAPPDTSGPSDVAGDDSVHRSLDTACHSSPQMAAPPLDAKSLESSIAAFRHVSIQFRSPYEQDNAAAQALLARFPTLRADLKYLVRLLVLECRFVLLLRFCDAFQVDVATLMQTLPWKTIGLHWSAAMLIASPAEEPAAGVGEAAALASYVSRKVFLERYELGLHVASIVTQAAALSVEPYHVLQSCLRTLTSETFALPSPAAPEISVAALVALQCAFHNVLAQ